MSRQKELARLCDELNTLAALDRLHDLASTHDAAETRAFELRQIRRSQITDEIEKVRTRRRTGRMSHFRIRTGILLLCAVGYAALRYLRR